MQITESDERDSTWEQHESMFRVYFATGDERAVTTFDIADATFLEVHDWATSTAGPETVVAIALVGVDNRGLRGLTWLVGMDPNDAPESDLEKRMFAELERPFV